MYVKWNNSFMANLIQFVSCFVFPFFSTQTVNSHSWVIYYRNYSMITTNVLLVNYLTQYKYRISPYFLIRVNQLN